MEIKIGTKSYNFTVKDLVYILSLVGVLIGWTIDHRINKFKYELREEFQDNTISELIEKNEKLFEYVTNNEKAIDRATTWIEYDARESRAAEED